MFKFKNIAFLILGISISTSMYPMQRYIANLSSKINRRHVAGAALVAGFAAICKGYEYYKSTKVSKEAVMPTAPVASASAAAAPAPSAASKSESENVELSPLEVAAKISAEARVASLKIKQDEIKRQEAAAWRGIVVKGTELTVLPRDLKLTVWWNRKRGATINDLARSFDSLKFIYKISEEELRELIKDAASMTQEQADKLLASV